MAATPLELAALSPVSATLAAGGFLSINGIKHLQKASELASSPEYVNRLRSGTEFGNFIGEVIGASLNKSVIVGSKLHPTNARPAGSFVPDFYIRGGIMEVKLTFSAVKKDQFVGFANYLENNGGLAMTYVFVTRPSDA